MASSAQMAAAEDDRKQRFRFHKDDEILLLQIVLRAKPCPYKISSRDGAIMVAWNSIAEEFKALCKPRHDGIVPHSRTCRTRTDKLIADFLANRATAHLRPQKQETKEDKIKNSLVAKLAAIQGKIEAPPPDPSDPADDAAESPIIPGAVSGTAHLTSPAHLLTQGSSSVPSSLSELQLHGHSHSQQQQQHRVSGGLPTTTLMPQSLVNIGSSNGHRMNHGQSTSALLAASSSLLLATTNTSGGGLHNNSHHQNSSPPNIFANPGSDQRPRDDGSQQQSSATGRKRRGNRNSTSAVSPVGTSQAPTSDYLQRPTSVHPERHIITPASKRLRSGAITAQNHSATSANNFDQQNGNKSNSNSNSGSNNNSNSNNNNSHNHNHNHHNHNSNSNSNSNNSNNNNIHVPNHTRPFLGGMGTSLGSSLPGQDTGDLSSVSNVGGNDDGHEEDDDDNDGDEGEDHESGGTGGGYQHDRDDDFGNVYDDGYGQQDDAEYANQTDASALLSLQSGSFSNNDNSQSNNSRNNKPSKRVAKRAAEREKVTMSKYSREVPSSNWPVPMHPASSNSGNSNEAGSSTAGPGYFVPSQLNAEDRAYLMRTLALEEQRVKVEVEKIALERERLALERSRLQWEMRQMN
ncbi:hypothetical protein EC968_002216 [Mortierella alpina]|nr:hypothetical protein EC968_002216 [Mortierella alpina]